MSQLFAANEWQQCTTDTNEHLIGTLRHHQIHAIVMAGVLTLGYDLICAAIVITYSRWFWLWVSQMLSCNNNKYKWSCFISSHPDDSRYTLLLEKDVVAFRITYIVISLGRVRSIIISIGRDNTDWSICLIHV